MRVYDFAFLKRLRTVSAVEGVSTLVLFGIAMPLKYLAGMPMAVRIVGSVHGFLFVWLVLLMIRAVYKVPLPPRLALIGSLAAVLPLGPFVFDRYLAELAKSNASSSVTEETAQELARGANQGATGR